MYARLALPIMSCTLTHAGCLLKLNTTVAECTNAMCKCIGTNPYLLELLVRHAQAKSKALQQLVHHAFAFAHESKGFIAEAWHMLINGPLAAPLPLVVCHLNALLMISKSCTPTCGRGVAGQVCFS